MTPRPSRVVLAPLHARQRNWEVVRDGENVGLALNERVDGEWGYDPERGAYLTEPEARHLARWLQEQGFLECKECGGPPCAHHCCDFYRTKDKP